MTEDCVSEDTGKSNVSKPDSMNFGEFGRSNISELSGVGARPPPLPTRLPARRRDCGPEAMRLGREWRLEPCLPDISELNNNPTIN